MPYQNFDLKKTEKLREESLEYQLKISKIKEKINKTVRLIQSMEADENDEYIYTSYIL